MECSPYLLALQAAAPGSSRVVPTTSLESAEFWGFVLPSTTETTPAVRASLAIAYKRHRRSVCFISDDVGLDHLAKTGLSRLLHRGSTPLSPPPYWTLWKDILRHSAYLRSLLYFLRVTNISYLEFPMQDVTLPPFAMLM